MLMLLLQQGILVCETGMTHMRGCHALCWKALCCILYVYLYPVVPAIAQHTNHRPAYSALHAQAEAACRASPLILHMSVTGHACLQALASEWALGALHER